MDCNSIIEGALKYRDGKKWKQRWAVLDKLSPVADVLQLQLYRDSRDRAKGAATKASLSLHNVLALQTGFTVDKESHTLGLLCQDVTLVVAFDTRERLLQWKVKVEATLGEEHQFLVQLIQVPSKARIATGPARMHVRDHRFCLAAGTPPRLLAAWSTHDLRRYGVVDGRVVWEGGSRCGRWAGIHVAISDAPHHVTHALDQASRGHITTPPPRPNSTNSSGSGGRAEIRAEAAKWIREVSALDLSSDTLSLAPSEATTIATSPRDAFPRVTCACYSATTPRDGYTRTNCECGHGSITPPPWERRSSCQSSWGPQHTSNGSSMGVSATESEGGWWAETLARGSWEGVTAPESLYDTPRPLAYVHADVHAESYQNSQQFTQQKQKQLHQQIQQKLQNHMAACDRRNCSGESPQAPVNPMDNYDIPPPPRPEPSTHYDTPRRLLPSMSDTRYSTLNQSADSGGWNDGSNVPTGPGCGQVLGWAGSMCGTKDQAEIVTEPIRVDGQGRMPVVDAYTGTIIRPPPPTPAPTPVPVQNPQQMEVESPPIYAVINKKKSIGKPRCPTPPPSPPPPRPVDATLTSNANYANLEFTESLSLYENARDIKSKLASNKPPVTSQNNPIPKCPARPPSQHSGAKNVQNNNVGSCPSLAACGNVTKQEQTHPDNTCPQHPKAHHPTLPLKKQQQRQNVNNTSSLPHPSKNKCSPPAPYQIQMNSAPTNQPEMQVSPQQTAICKICHKSPSVDFSDLYIPMGPRKTSEDSDYLPMQPKLQTVTTQTPSSDSSEAEQSRRQMVSEANNKHMAGIARCGRSHSVVSSERATKLAPRRSTSADSRPRESMIESTPNTPQSTPTHQKTNGSLRRCDRGINRCDAAVDSGCDLHLDMTETLMVDDASISMKQQEEETTSIIDDDESSDNPSCILRRSLSVPNSNKSNVSNRDSASSSDSGVYESPRAVDRLLSSHCLHTSLPRPRRPACFHISGGVTSSCQELGVTSSSIGMSTGDAKSTSSGASDMSDYLDTLSLSSHSSSDHDRLMARSSVNTLRPRSGREYSRLDRCAICPEEKKTLPVLGEALPH